MRTCYQCHQEIPNIEGKYFCDQLCWDLWGKSYSKPIKLSIKEMQSKLIEFGKKAGNTPEGIIEEEEIAKQIGLI